MAISRTVSEINGDFSRKSPFFPPIPRVAFNAPVEWFPWNLVPAQGVEKARMVELPVPACDGRTDSHLSTAKTALSLTSRG